ncbi:ABC transporter permease [Desmospora profundinema]|uniref:ABC-2 type transport system permease protein n=1 Tax=Desmospora profundinema TaxID=1571184 RepID=A0ABU1IS16_9BACL|nr:ABC transporter permease [Desmospora profundinema]MDR6227578.1 ABC-2 type transport system permease protein [Desmospora profundinema]
MKAYWRLTLAQLLLFIRNKNTIIWSLLLPVFMMLALGTFLGNGGNQFTLQTVVVDEDQTPVSRELADAFQGTEGLAVTAADRKSGLEQVRSGEADMMVVLKKGLGEEVERFQSSGEARAVEQIALYLDGSNPTVSEVGTSVIAQVVDERNKELVGFRPVVSTEQVDVQARPLGYIDFLVPGILSLMIMSNNLNGVAATIASWRERGILRRMQGTPLKSSTFIAGQITARVLLNGLQAVTVLLVAYFLFDVQVNGSWVLLLAVLLLGTLTFMSIGFIIASLAKNPESAAPIAGLVTFPMIFVGGIFFPIRDLPGLLQPLIQLIPIGHLTDSLRGVMNDGATLAQLSMPLSILAAWLFVSFTVAAATFRWDVK